MRIAPLAEVKARLSTYVEQAQREGPVVITRNGRPVAVLLVPVSDEDLEDLLLSRSPRFQAMLARSQQSVAAGQGLPEAAFWQLAETQATYDTGVEDEKAADKP
jgi:prevent-host-death family protein